MERVDRDTPPSSLRTFSENLNQYEGTLNDKAVKLSYAAFPDKGDRLQFPAGNALCGDYGTRQRVEVYNDQIICVIKKEQGVETYVIKCVVEETSDTYQLEWRLEIKDATNLPPDFVEDNYVSKLFPFVPSLWKAQSLVEKQIDSCFYVVISTHSGKR